MIIILNTSLINLDFVHKITKSYVTTSNSNRPILEFCIYNVGDETPVVISSGSLSKLQFSEAQLSLWEPDDPNGMFEPSHSFKEEKELINFLAKDSKKGQERIEAFNESYDKLINLWSNNQSKIPTFKF